ncbi:probable LRR receptor-like serine/threonine-protein kinase At3g47570 [Magnolia sinica]|uniref:probable LRR receptor-like serine/threonine-protein kinase At3g47570 n=1 Tax=Magnolia sinica TaxID=86752 RepID=UPI00265B2EE7|nr:probable LRR receptor-like serine/threonine-protein kinase At3g47570 [Magnolia sinica]
MLKGYNPISNQIPPAFFWFPWFFFFFSSSLAFQMIRKMVLGFLRPRAFWSLFLLPFLLPYINCKGIGSPALRNETDRLALISFKDLISNDPLQFLSSWNSSFHFCNWKGVTCGRRHPQRVTALNLGSHGLVGPISPHISNLTFLRTINLSTNSFQGEIPREIGKLFRLQDLDLSYNGLQGEIPNDLFNCSELRSLSLYQNKLQGRIPVVLSYLSKLTRLNLGRNNLIGNIPPSLGNLSSLVSLFLFQNSLEGSIPDELGWLVKLKSLQISFNKLSGLIPPLLYNLSSMDHISVAVNKLHGNLPPNLGLTLPNLKIILLGVNAFTGPIPVSLANASGLIEIDFYSNYFSGPVPENLGRLQELSFLNLPENQLGSGEGDDDLGFITSLTNCSNLKGLILNANQLRGKLPATIVNLSTHLIDLELAENPISGIIPTDISNLVNLNRLTIFATSLMGTIPFSVGKLQNLEGLFLQRNRLSGPIPSSIGNISRLVRLLLFDNRLQGNIPSSLGKCRHLQFLSLGKNELNGTIPKEILSIPSLVRVNLIENSFVGSLLLEDGNLYQLQYFKAAHNKLMGEIPSSLHNILSLVDLNLSNNLFQGAIPMGLNNSKDLTWLDLSHNNLSGHIPVDLEKLPVLELLDLSYNDLDGEVPHQGIFKNMSAFSVLGNKMLCGGIPQLQLPACPKKASQKHGRSITLIVIFSVVGVVIGLILLSFLFVTLCRARRKARKEPLPTSFLEGRLLNVSYGDLFKATGGFSSDNLIGMGSYGSVYKGILDRDETLIAVKVLNLQQRAASRSFLAECEALRNIRHRNLVKIITACSSIDFQGNDFKALVFEYMPNGNLEKWLHPNVHGLHESRSLNFIQRLDIAIDVASALEYLHHHCSTPIVHRDLKPSNVLLDDDMCAHVGDFGLARFLSIAASNTSQDQTSSTGIKGSIGYIPPEYGMGRKASTHGDVYSYGILLLEMFTGKRPTDNMFKDGLSLHQFGEMALPDQVMDIVDPRLLSEEVQDLNNGEQHRIARSKMQECLASVVKIGVACSREFSNERMEMRDIAGKIHAMRDLYLGVGIHRDQQNGAQLLGQGPSYLSHY